MGYTTDPDATAYPAGSLAETYGFGLTKREYFAAMALQGILGNPTSGNLKDCIAEAIDAADLLIAALNEKNQS